MLTDNEERAPAVPSHGPNVAAEAVATQDAKAGQTPLERMLRIEWLGQTAASLCWIGSVFSYGVSSSADWLQLLAASSWLLANIASAVTAKAD